MSREGSTEEFRAVRTVDTADGVNGGVKVRRESFVDCAFRDAADADRRGSGDGVELGGCSLAGTLDWLLDRVMEFEN